MHRNNFRRGRARQLRFTLDLDELNAPDWSTAFSTERRKNSLAVARSAIVSVVSDFYGVQEARVRCELHEAALSEDRTNYYLGVEIRVDEELFRWGVATWSCGVVTLRLKKRNTDLLL